MKKIILSLLLCLFMSLCFAQNDNVLTEDLQEILNQKNNDLIDINILLKSQMPTEHLTHLNVKSDSKEVRREIVINELKKFSEQQQESVMSVINAETRSNNVTDVKSHWLVNSINCKASRDVIYTLASHPDIKHIDYNKEEKMFQGEDQELREQGAGSRGSVSSMTDNITHVQAEKVWDLGYTGKGVIVAVIDSGVNLDHVDLKDHLWDGGQEYPYHGYNFVNPGQAPYDDKGHGTHCAGTICGDGTSGLATGIAPDATLMCLKTSSKTETSTTFDRLSSAIEFAVEHGADIISISVGGWINDNVARASFRQIFDNALNLGVITSAAAGNNRQYLTTTLPAPRNINSPSDCPPPWIHPDQQSNGTNVSGVVSVGGVNYENQVISISSQGPTTWQETSYADYPHNPEIGLIRPDIVAPGDGIKSLDYETNNGYAIKSGTSMAAPCVAGVMALMLEKNPELTPADICRIIETTATELTPTKSNDYGSGCINALAAVQAVNFDVAGSYLKQYSFTKNFVALTSNANQNLELTLINNGTLATAGTTNVTLTSNDDYVEIVNGNASINNSIAVGGTATCNFTIKINTLSPDNHIAKLTVNAGTSSFNIEINISNEFVAPSNFTTEVQNLRNVYLSWNATNNATGYKIYRDGAYVGETSTTSYTDENLDYGTLYTYTITTKRGELETEHSREIRVQTADNPEAPSPTNIVATDNNSSVAISWNNSTGSKGSNIYRKDNIAGTETQIASNVSGNSYTDNISLQEGIYQYGVANLHSEKETIYEEEFENNGTSLPNNDWNVYRNDGASQNNWGVKASQTTNNTEFTPYMGNYAAFSFYGANNYAIKCYLVTPSFDLSEYQGSDVTLSFYYITPAWGTDVNNLNVRIRSSPTGPWSDAIWTSNKTDVTEWTKAEVDITSYAGSTFYIAFENEIGYGLCSAVDNVSIAIDGNKESRIEWSDNIYKNVNVINKDGDWNNTDNWATNQLPTENDNHITIDANAVINGTVEVNSLTINEGASLTLNAGAKLIVNGDFVNTDADAFIINDGAQVVHNSENLPATFNMNIVNPNEWSSNNKTGWQFISSPVKDAKINDFIPESSDYDLYRYDGTKNLEWINHKDENDYGDDDEPETPVTPTAPAAPVVTATAISSSQIQLSWEAVAGATSYKVYSVGNELTETTGTNYTVSSLQPNKSYCFSVSALNENGESAQTEACATTLNAKPITPYDFTATATGESTIELSWSPANRATSYNVYQGDEKIATVTEPTYTVEGLEPETNYCFTVTAENEMGESDKTEEKCATTEEKAPTIVEIGTESDGTGLGYLPVYDNSAYSISQQIYTSNDIALGNGTIRSVSFRVGDRGNAATRQYEVYLKNITASSFYENGYEYFELSSSDKVYDGAVAVGGKQEWFTINFTTPFEYTGGNVVLCVYDKTGNSLPNGDYHNFYKYAASGRSLYNKGYSAYDPTTLATSVSGTTTEPYVNLIRFGIVPSEVVVPVAPTLSATATSSSEISLTWNLVPGATSYNVYKDDEQIATGLTETTLNVEDLEAGTEYCFTVTAVNTAGESDESEGACAITDINILTVDIDEINGQNAISSSNYYFPVYDFYPYALSQQIYTAEEIGFDEGTIYSVSFRVGMYGGVVDRQYEVYMKNINEDTFTSNDYLDLSSSDKVFDGEVKLATTNNWYDIKFTTPFNYTGGNVLLCVYDKTGTGSSPYHSFYQITASNRSLYSYGDYAYDPTNLTEGTSRSYVSQVRFEMTGAFTKVPNAPVLTAEANSSSSISLTWDAVAKATRYNVYQNGNSIASNITETSYTVEGLETGEEYCFTVTAVNEVGESEHSEEACAVPAIVPEIVSVEIGANATYSSYWVPFCDYYGNYISQQIYTKDEIGCVGTINSVSFKVSSGIATTRNLEVYMKNIDQDAFSGSFIALSASDKVFDGNVTVGTAGTWLSIPFSTPFDYTGNNVVVCVHDKTGSGLSSYHNFYSTYTTGKSLYSYSSTNPISLTTGLTTSYRSQIKFEIEVTPKVPDAPVLTAETNSSSSISLTWDDVANATSYNVYQGSALITSGLTETSYTVEGLETGEEYCFTVTAVNEVGESEASNEKCVTAGEEQLAATILGTGEPGNAADIPSYPYYKYSISQQIYLADEMQGNIGNITSITFFNVTGTQVNTRNIDVYMVHTTNSYFTTTNINTNFVSMAESDKVYSGTYTFDASTQYSTIELTTPFAYNGQDNIILTVVDNTGTDCGTPSKANSFTTFNSGTYRTIAHKQDTWGAYNITTLQTANGTSFSGNGTPRSAVNQIQFTFGSSSKSATREVSSVSPSRGAFETAFQQGVGYMASYEKENIAVFKGNLNHEKSYVFPVSYNSEKDLANFHLLGNPFSFNMKWSNVTATNLASGYAVVNETGGYTYRGAADDEIAVGDGFFVKATSENPSISYSEGRTLRNEKSQSIDVVITGNAGSDNVVVNLGKAGEEGFPKLKNFNEEITTIFVYNNDKSYGIYNCEEEVEEVPIYLNNTNGMGKYTISIDAKGDFENITLVDLVSGDETNMLVHDYNFTASQQENTKRFILKFVEKQQTTDNSNFVYQSGEELIVNTQGMVQIIDIVGRVVYNNVVLNESERINISGFTTGTYIVRVIGESEVMTQKIVVY